MKLEQTSLIKAAIALTGAQEDLNKLLDKHILPDLQENMHHFKQYSFTNQRIIDSVKRLGDTEEVENMQRANLKFKNIKGKFDACLVQVNKEKVAYYKEIDAAIKSKSEAEATQYTVQSNGEWELVERRFTVKREAGGRTYHNKVITRQLHHIPSQEDADALRAVVDETASDDII